MSVHFTVMLSSVRKIGLREKYPIYGRVLMNSKAECRNAQCKLSSMLPSIGTTIMQNLNLNLFSNIHLIGFSDFHLYKFIICRLDSLARKFSWKVEKHENPFFNLHIYHIHTRMHTLLFSQFQREL